MIYLIVAMLLYTAAVMVGAVASRSANTNLVAGVTNVISTIIPLVVVAPLLVQPKVLQGQKFGIYMAVLGGVLISLFVMSLNKSYTLNKVGIVTPVVFGGAIFLSTLLGFLWLKEKVSPLQLAGLGFLGVGLVLIIVARATGK